MGNPGNSPDSGTGNLYGSVDHAYDIGKYEVTAAQYTEFLNLKAQADPYGLYNTYMTDLYYYGCNIQRSGVSGSYSYSVAADWANRPVNHVSFWDAARFTNWLHNGQGAGDTETGAYTLTPAGISANTVTKNAGAQWWIPSENEWYKAAYHKNDGATGNYFDYPTGSDTAPGRSMADVSGNNANYYGATYPIDSGKYTTLVGEFQNSDSPYGTFDQGGNVWEWNDTIIAGSSRRLRGGTFAYYSSYLDSSHPVDVGPSGEGGGMGFRVAGAIVPEPGSVAMLLGLALTALLYGWRPSFSERLPRA